MSLLPRQRIFLLLALMLPASLFFYGPLARWLWLRLGHLPIQLFFWWFVFIFLLWLWQYYEASQKS